MIRQIGHDIAGLHIHEAPLHVAGFGPDERQPVTFGHLQQHGTHDTVKIRTRYDSHGLSPTGNCRRSVAVVRATPWQLSIPVLL